MARANSSRHSGLRPAAALIAAIIAFTACATMQGTGREQPLRAMTYNIQYGNEGIDSVADVIRAEKPDIVGLQEVDVHWADRSAYIDQAERLSKQTGMAVRFARIYQFPNADPARPPREFGVAILSRYPIVSFMNHTISRLSTQEENPVPRPLPGFLEAVIDVNGTSVRVFNVHLDYRRDPAVRAKQVEEMLGYIGNSAVPTLLFGDLNARPDAPELQPLLRKLHDTWPYSVSPGLTMPATDPTGKIDYVLTSGGFRVVKARVPQVHASDHLPVVVDLLMTR